MIAKWGTAIAFLLFIILFIKFLVRLSIVRESPSQQAEHFMQLVIVAVSVVVLAVPEGLPLAVTLSLAYATVRMLKDNNLVRVLKACETMGNVTTICCDKTGTLTENKMTVVVGTMGVSDQFVRKSLPVIDTVSLQQNDAEAEMGGADAVPMQTYFGAMPDEVRTLLRQSIAVNSTAFEGVDEQGNKTFIGSKTETALLDMANDYLGMDDVATERENANVVQPIPFSSERKWMGTVVKMETGGHIFHRLFVKGGVEIVLKSSNRVIDFTNSNELARDLSDEDIRIINETNTEYASRTLRTIALAYRDFEQWPPKGARVSRSDNTAVEIGDLFKNLGFISIVGIMDPLRPGVTQAVSDCRKAGVFVRMITGDNLLTAKAIAHECGILTSGGIVMEGPSFRNLAPSQMDIVIPRLQVLARSSPQDKRTMVEHLKKLGETVAVTGDGTNDGPALRAADVGFSMGIAGTEVAKEASSIILMDDNFKSIVSAIAWGRCVNDSIKKFLQVPYRVQLSIDSLVSAYCQRCWCWNHVCDRCCQYQRIAFYYTGSTALGQFDSGHIRGFGIGHGPADFGFAQSLARVQSSINDFI
jgi:P-type Ca2+ transporter type 2C